MRDIDAMDRIILQLSAGDAGMIARLRTEYTHVQVVEAWKSKLLSE